MLLPEFARPRTNSMDVDWKSDENGIVSLPEFQPQAQRLYRCIGSNSAEYSIPAPLQQRNEYLGPKQLQLHGLFVLSDRSCRKTGSMVGTRLGRGAVTLMGRLDALKSLCFGPAEGMISRTSDSATIDSDYAPSRSLRVRAVHA
ncbi:MAG TPA: hypothetical protein VJM12_17705 [Pyrinomonadaceae bacterium]|nr:hypothetical protein [Pyrinomonadaceae bacterium]